MWHTSFTFKRVAWWRNLSMSCRCLVDVLSMSCRCLVDPIWATVLRNTPFEYVTHCNESCHTFTCWSVMAHMCSTTMLSHMCTTTMMCTTNNAFIRCLSHAHSLSLAFSLAGQGSVGCELGHVGAEQSVRNLSHVVPWNKNKSQDMSSLKTCHTYQWVILHTYEYECVMRHMRHRTHSYAWLIWIWRSHVTHSYEWIVWHTFEYEWVMRHMKESCQRYAAQASVRSELEHGGAQKKCFSYVTLTNESCRTYQREWDMSHMHLKKVFFFFLSLSLSHTHSLSPSPLQPKDVLSPSWAIWLRDKSAWIMSAKWMSHVTHINVKETCHTWAPRSVSSLSSSFSHTIFHTPYPLQVKEVLDASWAMSLRNKVLESCHTCEYVVYVNVNESCATHAAQRGIRSELGHVDTQQSARSFATAPAPAAHARNRRSRSSQVWQIYLNSHKLSVTGLYAL